MLKKLVKIGKELVNRAVFEVSMEALRQLGINGELLDIAVEESAHMPQPQEEVPEQEVEMEMEAPVPDIEAEEEANPWLITQIYDIMPVSQDEKVSALCVQIVNMKTGQRGWVPYMYVQRIKEVPPSTE
jgi:hypothetical protein